MKDLVKAIIVLLLVLDCLAVEGRVAGRVEHDRRSRRYKRQESRRAGPPSRAINYASLQTGSVPSRVRNRVGRPVASSSAGSTSASASGSSGGNTGASGGYGAQTPYNTPYNPAGNTYGSTAGRESNPYTGYGETSYYGGQVGPQPVTRGKSTYPFPNQQALNSYLKQQGRQQAYQQSSYGGSSRNPYGGYQQGGGYPQGRLPQYGGYSQMYGGYPMPMNPYAGMYGQPMAPMTPYGYPPAGGYYYGGYNRGYQEPSGVSIGSAYRNSGTQSLPRTVYPSGSYGHGSSGSGSYGGSATSGYGSYTDSGSYGGSSPYGGGGSSSYGSSPYGNGASSGSDSAGSYGGTTGSFRNGQSSYGRTGSAYGGGGSSASESDDSSYGGYGSYGAGQSGSYGAAQSGSSGSGRSGSVGTGQSGSFGSDSRTPSYGGSYGSSGSYGGADSAGYGYTSGSRYGSSGSQNTDTDPETPSYGDQSYGGDETAYSQISGSRYGGASSGSRYTSSGAANPYGDTGESEASSRYSFGQYGGDYGGASAGTAQAAAGGSSGTFGRFFNHPSAEESDDEYSRIFQTQGASGTSAPETEEANIPFSPRGQYPSFGGTYTNSEAREEEAEENEVPVELFAADRNPVSPGEPESESGAREMQPREEDSIFLVPRRQNQGGRQRQRNRGREREDSWRVEAEEDIRRPKKPKAAYSSLEKCLPKPNGLPDLYIDHRKMKTSVRLELKPLSELSCAMSENCLAESASISNPVQMRKLLRFATIAHNNGTGIFLPALPPKDWYYHPCHKHHHSMKVFAQYNLLNESGHLVAKGHKAGFCLEDSGCRNPCVKNYKCSNDTQGISPGCYDTYASSRDCQWIDVTDVLPEPMMTYTLRVTVNPIVDGVRVVPELSYTNNVVECSVRIRVSTAQAIRCWMK